MWPNSGMFDVGETSTDRLVQDIRELKENISKLVDSLHDEELLDFDRDDIDD